MATRRNGSKTPRNARGGWEYRVIKPLDRSGLSEEQWGEQCATELTKVGSEGWEACGQVGPGHLLLKRQK